ncbi:uncharacterized protein [Spinacia oleracea]|uniref:Uncharacterized protein isoform X1 n=1 Tax=Spinacia oleracea TaxID=3562 RepID=A0ABM3R375_SPIOL|nr:uncharacterized protein LOC130465002 isoform X1 [Spinacia oleracea]
MGILVSKSAVGNFEAKWDWHSWRTTLSMSFSPLPESMAGAIFHGLLQSSWLICMCRVHHNLASLSAGMTCAFEYQVQGHDGYSTVGYLDELSHNSMLLYLEEVKACLVWSELQLMLLRKFWRVDIL